MGSNGGGGELHESSRRSMAKRREIAQIAGICPQSAVSSLLLSFRDWKNGGGPCHD